MSTESEDGFIKWIACDLLGMGPDAAAKFQSDCRLLAERAKASGVEDQLLEWAAYETLDKASEGTVGFQAICRDLAASVKTDGIESMYRKCQARLPGLNQQLFNRMLNLGCQPTSRPMDEYLSVMLDFFCAIRPKPPPRPPNVPPPSGS